jgi:amyloid beta precursor protein binding protein 1
MQHGGQIPRDLSDEGGVDEHREFKQVLNGMRHKADEENFDEATAQAYQVWGESQVRVIGSTRYS